MPDVDEPGAIPMFVAENRVFIDQNNHTWVVIHKTASGGRAQDIAHFFANDPAMASTHYVIGQDGTIVQCVQEKDGAGGNCCEKGNFAPFLPVGQNLNTWTVSIEHVDPASDNSTPLTDAQKAASFRLIRHICQRHNIPMRRGDAAGGIIGHADIDPVDRAHCPGNYPWDELFSYLNQGEGSMMVPTGWHDDGTALTAPNGHRVVLGFRSYVLNAPGGWDARNQPLGEEFHANPLEYSNPGLGSGQKQIFTWTTLEWTRDRGVFEAWQGQEIAKLLQMLTQAQTPAQIPASVIDDLRALRASNVANDAALAKVLMELGVPV